MGSGPRRAFARCFTPERCRSRRSWASRHRRRSSLSSARSPRRLPSAARPSRSSSSHGATGSIRCGVCRSGRRFADRRRGRCSSTAPGCGSSTRDGCSRAGSPSSTSTPGSTIGGPSPRSGRSREPRCSPAATATRALDALVAASDRHASAVCRSLRHGVLAASTDVLGALVGGARRTGRHDGQRRVRAGVDDRLSHPVPAVRRSAVARARLASGLPRQLQHRVAACGGRRRAGRHRAVGGAARDCTPGARGMRRRRSARHAVQRTSLRAGANAARRAPRSGRRVRAPCGARAVHTAGCRRRRTRSDRLSRSRRRTARRGLRNAARLRASRASPGRTARLTDEARGHAANPAPASARATGIVLYAAADRATTSSAARWGRSSATSRPKRFSSCTSSIRRWAAAPSSLPRAAYLAQRVRDRARSQRRLSRRATSTTPSAAAIRRTIAERCLYGVDLNPMAVQLARLSLWLTTLAADRPSPFSIITSVRRQLLGAWLAEPAARAARSPKRKRSPSATLPLFDDDDRRRRVTRRAAGAFLARNRLPTTRSQQVREKERALAALNASQTARCRPGSESPISGAPRGSEIPDADMPAAAFGALSDAMLTGRGSLPASNEPRATSAIVDRRSPARRNSSTGSWNFRRCSSMPDGARRDRPRLRRRRRQSAVGHDPCRRRRRRRRGRLARTELERLRPIYARLRASTTRSRAGTRIVISSFVERAIALTRPGGRIGWCCRPASRPITAARRSPAASFSRCDVDALVGFDNRRGVFPIHRSVGFLLLTATAGGPTTSIGVPARRVDDPAVLETADERSRPRGAAWFPVASRRQTFCDTLSGRRLAIPTFARRSISRSPSARSALFRPLGDEAGWSARFGRELNATDDRCDRSDRPAHGLAGRRGQTASRRSGPIWPPARSSIVPAADAGGCLPDRATSARASRIATSRARRNRLTLIAAILPAGCVSTHTVFCLRNPLGPLAPAFPLRAVQQLRRELTSCGLRVTTHVTTAIVERLPIPDARTSLHRLSRRSRRSRGCSTRRRDPHVRGAPEGARRPPVSADAQHEFAACAVARFRWCRRKSAGRHLRHLPRRRMVAFQADELSGRVTSHSCRLNTSAATTPGQSSTSTIVVSTTNSQSRSTAYPTIDTATTRATGVARRTTRPVGEEAACDSAGSRRRQRQEQAERRGTPSSMLTPTHEHVGRSDALEPGVVVTAPP